MEQKLESTIEGLGFRDITPTRSLSRASATRGKMDMIFEILMFSKLETTMPL